LRRKYLPDERRHAAGDALNEGEVLRALVSACSVLNAGNIASEIGESQRLALCGCDDVVRWYQYAW
jgi:hypothetical protein